MKLIHLSDLHFGKRVNGYSMIDDQKYIVRRILEIIDEEHPDGVMIAGDLYDKSVPSEDAVELADDFLNMLVERNLKIFIISGNHDSEQRVAYGANIMKKSDIHISPVFDGTVSKVSLTDEYGPVNVFLLPFLRMADAKRFAHDPEDITDYTGAIASVIGGINVDTSERNIILSHQFVTGAATSESEERNVGGLDNVDASVYDDFDYVALGHIHGPQSIGRKTVRYAGTPLKYSFSEKDHIKSVTIVELKEKGNVTVKETVLLPMHDLREIRGTYDELMLRENHDDETANDYLRVVLTDETDVPEAMNKMKNAYPNIMELVYDNLRTRHQASVGTPVEVETKTNYEIFEDLFEHINGKGLDDEQSEIFRDIEEKIWRS